MGCEPIVQRYFDIEKEYCIIKIVDIKNDKRKKIYLKDIDGRNYYFYTFDNNYNRGDKFKLVKIEE